MNEHFLKENQSKRINVSFTLLFFYSLLTVWQMGVVFFSSESLSLNGKTPLPIDTDSTTALIVVAYLLSICFLIFFQKFSVLIARAGIFVSLLATLALYLPLSDTTLAMLIYTQTFFVFF